MNWVERQMYLRMLREIEDWIIKNAPNGYFMSYVKFDFRSDKVARSLRKRLAFMNIESYEYETREGWWFYFSIKPMYYFYH